MTFGRRLNQRKKIADTTLLPTYLPRGMIIAVMIPDSEQENKGHRRKRDGVATYAKIALDIANRIVNGEMPEGRRLSGRSLMSTEYGVSPETIRRAFSLLEELQVVEVMQNSGVRVKSRVNAVKYIAKHSNRHDTKTLLSRMKQLVEQHEAIERELFEVVRQLVDSTERFASSNPFYTYECAVSDESPILGQTLGDLSFWQKTRATVIAIRRDGSIILSPGPGLTLQALDVLVLVGNQETKAAVESLVQ